MKSARFEKASEEIGVPRGKKSERYRSTAHSQSQSDRHDLFRLRALNPLPAPGIVVGAVHGRRGTRAAARGAPGAAR